MGHYVLGLVFSKSRGKILLIEKKRPKWQAGRWNGIGGKIEQNESPIGAMQREALEETGHSFLYKHVITFVCPGGTVFVFEAITCATNADYIPFEQVEDGRLEVFDLDNLPTNMMGNLRWIIPLSLASVYHPILIQQKTLGVEV